MFPEELTKLQQGESIKKDPYGKMGLYLDSHAEVTFFKISVEKEQRYFSNYYFCNLQTFTIDGVYPVSSFFFVAPKPASGEVCKSTHIRSKLRVV